MKSMVILAVPLVVFLAACNGETFSSTGANASSQTVFGGNTASPTPAPGPKGGSGDGMAPPSGSNSNSAPLPVSYLCSNKYTIKDGSNVLASANLALNFVSDSGTVSCTETLGVRNSILNTKNIALNACATLANGTYHLKLIDPAANGGQGSLDLFSDSTRVDVAGGMITKVSSGLNNGFAEVLYDGNDQNDKNSSSSSSDQNCDRRASPLVVDMSRHHDQFVTLTAQTDGVLFDILGSNSSTSGSAASPGAHQKKQISWIQNSDLMFIVLPDENGDVNGIDQMFGDNTTGPDGQHANNGYEALHKFDGRSIDGKARIGKANGRIDRHDPIYSKLRMWSDKNFDGVAQPDELYTLRELGIVYINLNYNALYEEIDVYGNQTKYKSVVGLKDGTLNLIFDIWFRYL